MIGSNTLYCNICSGIRESDFKLSLSSVENCLIVQLYRFFVLNGIATKNSAPFFVLSSTEAVTELEDEVFYTKIFNLAAIHVFQLLTSYPMDRKYLPDLNKCYRSHSLMSITSCSYDFKISS